MVTPRGDSLRKMLEMLIVSLRGVKHRFWSHLECSGQNPNIFYIKVLFRIARQEVEITVILCFQWRPIRHENGIFKGGDSLLPFNLRLRKFSDIFCKPNLIRISFLHTFVPCKIPPRVSNHGHF